MKWYEKLLKWGFNSNYWVWFHILVGGILAKISVSFVSPLLTVAEVIVIAMVWEVYEYNRDKDRLEEIYGSVEKFVYDSIGDIVGAVLCAVLVVI